MNVRLLKLATNLRDYFIGSFIKCDYVSIFLCGGSSLVDSQFRRELGSLISAIKSKYRYSVYYPEDMFVELILGHQRQDLLTLENLLAESVSAVVLLLQSPGTFVELGAFSNHPRLRDRLFVVIDPRYKKSHSFINTGPVRHLQKQTKSWVIYHGMKASDTVPLSKLIIQASREIALLSPPTIDLTNPIASQEFYLALVMTLDPVPRTAVLKLAELLHPNSPTLAKTAAETVLNTLVNQGYAVLISGALRISKKGIDSLYAGARTAIRKAELRIFLSQRRIEALNVLLRKRKYRLWGDVA